VQLAAEAAMDVAVAARAAVVAEALLSGHGGLAAPVPAGLDADEAGLAVVVLVSIL
jgi:hypothetical protein